jgi:hypothetical protein
MKIFHGPEGIPEALCRVHKAAVSISAAVERFISQGKNILKFMVSFRTLEKNEVGIAKITQRGQ